jgi:hypothetical protein
VRGRIIRLLPFSQPLQLIWAVNCTIHGFFTMTGFLDLARNAVAEAAAALRQSLR